jgi:signal peptidase I
VSEQRKYFIKRVIGLPGETLKISDGFVFIKKLGSSDFEALDESQYLNAENLGNTKVRESREEHIFEIPENRYFLMGDNRQHSTDSRSCFSSCNIRGHFIAPNELLGKLFIDLGYFSFSQMSFTQPYLGRDSRPRFFSSPGSISY